jgi:hypothetical protein
MNACEFRFYLGRSSFASRRRASPLPGAYRDSQRLVTESTECFRFALEFAGCAHRSYPTWRLLRLLELAAFRKRRRTVRLDVLKELGE